MSGLGIAGNHPNKKCQKHWRHNNNSNINISININISMSSAHTHSILTAIIPGEPVLASCPLNSPSPFIPAWAAHPFGTGLNFQNEQQ